MRKLVDTLNIVLGVLTGCLLVALYLDASGSMLGGIERVTSGWAGLVLAIVGAVVVVLNALQAVRELQTSSQRRDLRVTTEEGVNTLSVAALERQLLEELRQADDVADPTVTLEPHGEGQPVDCRLRFKLRRQNDVMRRVDTLKRQVRDSFLRMIPAGIGIEISARVIDLVDQAPVQREESGGAPAFSGPDFSGYETEGAEEHQG